MRLPLILQFFDQGRALSVQFQISLDLIGVDARGKNFFSILVKNEDIVALVFDLNSQEFVEDALAGEVHERESC